MTLRYLQEHAELGQDAGKMPDGVHTARWVLARGPSTLRAGGVAAVAGLAPMAVWAAFWLPPTTPVWSFLIPVVLGVVLAFGVTPAVEAAIGPPVAPESGARHVDWGKVRALRGQPWAMLPAKNTQEGNVARRAADIHDRIVKSPIWGSGLLDTHNVRVDPAAEVVQIAQRLSRLADLRGRLRRAQATTGTDALASQLAALEEVHLSITRRVDALAAYEIQVHALAAEHSKVNALVAAGDHTDEVLDLLSQTAGDAITAGQLESIGNEVEASREVMQDLVGAMSEPLQILAETVPGPVRL
ncbi:hypothetical protein [Kribbella qitaiheensis]|nr:hypothetical protein [Kribbella qitaiheensis]